MKLKLSFIILFTSLTTCKAQGKPEPHPIYKSILSDSALFYYELGWKQIMDEGNYGPAEQSYRKVLEHDPNFLIGKNVLGRLTLNTEERLRIQAETEAEKNRITGDERLILDVYAALVEYTNARELKSARLQEIRKKTFKIAEENLRTIVQKYPEQIYMKAEYIEFLHAAYGPKRALDSLEILTTAAQKKNPFVLGYAASMHSEIGNFQKALQMATELMHAMQKKNVPKPFVVMADVYYRMDSLQLAKENVDKAVILDPRNLDASRLKVQIVERQKEK